MTALFLGHVALFSTFPLYFSTLEPLVRRIHFYLYLALVLLVGGFLGNAYSLVLAPGLAVSGGSLCYGAFMITAVLFVLIERDIFILRHVIRLVVIVDGFNIAFSLLASAALSHPAAINPHATPAALFGQSIPSIVLGGVLIVAELLTLLFWFETVKRWGLRTPLVELAYLLGFVTVLCLDGVLFPFLALGVSHAVVVAVGIGLGGKALTALAFSVPLALFMIFSHKRFASFLDTDVFTWRVFLATSSDLIRELSANDRALRQADAVFREANDGLAVLDAQGELLRANAAFKRLTGAPERAALSWFHHAGKALALPPETPVPWHGEVGFGDGYRAQGLLSVMAVAGEGSAPPTYVYSLTDITEQKRVQAELDHLAMHDALTDLPNRRALDTALRGLEGAAALGILDLDRFKDVNDSFGHVMGDDLLRQVAQRMRQACPADAATSVFRIGGDEFALLLPGAGEAALRAAVARLNQVLAPPFALANAANVALTATWGASLTTQAAGDDLFAKADAALYEVKHGAKDALGLYQERLTHAAQRRLSLGARLRETLDRQLPSPHDPQDGPIWVAYQPQLGRDGTLFGWEALARWSDPELGAIAPGEFVALAENQGLIATLGTFMLRSACRDGALWLAAGLAVGKIAVNVSALQVRTRGFVESVAAALHDSGFPPERLQIELTETVFLGREGEVLPVFEALKALGVQLAVDDFGTGYSALSFLPMLPWDTLKIDRSFVVPATHDDRRKALVAAIVRMAKELELAVVAEGVETDAQHELLLGIGCDAFQGYLFARPLPAEDAVGFMAARPASCAPETRPH
ncbi:EAL domain-containing protein [Novosphingobium sp. 1949]|uniref:EAL domain-containing protein n=1 Tax=Novosphingobium organovorum TaxID=2930092 RepID=A0ABT0BDE6_9SPHN|nr:bifunctional diguanylate cyclase/phosphodiesterase [Novosphingobium organovorum]MCJ2182868.1 EAL domain-containing protein [Novosphingobium organovorum]